MSNPYVLILLLLSVLLVVVILVNGIYRKVEFFSCRNFFLAGFIVFQLMSAATAVISDNYGMFPVASPKSSIAIFTGYSIVFLILFMASYHLLPIARWATRLLKSLPREASDSSMLIAAIILVSIALPGRFLSSYIPFRPAAMVGIYASFGFAALAAAIAGWVWGRRIANPFAASISLLIFCTSLVVGLTSGFGRRPLLSVVVALVWGVYYRWARTVQPLKLLIYVLPFVLIGGIAVSKFTAARSQETRNLSIPELVKSVAAADTARGAYLLFQGQDCGACALWCIENFPENHEPKVLHTLKYFFYIWVPRSWWPDKPVTLANEIAHLAQIEGVNRDAITLTPGVVGYAAAEGGMLAIIVYAICLGQFVRFFDQLIVNNISNPFIVLSISCTLGEFFGLPRGGVDLFASIIIINFVLTFLVLWIMSRLIGRVIKSDTDWFGPTADEPTIVVPNYSRYDP
jgi:hypothetical protein